MISEISESTIKSTWMTFECTQTRTDKIKTEKWNVISRRRGVILGEIHWYGPWRQYVLAPANVAPLFNQGCLRDIQDVLSILNREQRARYRRRNSSD